MKIYYEFRCTWNDKCAKKEHLDYVVASICHVPCDDRHYTVPAGNRVNWLQLIHSILSLKGEKYIEDHQPVEMDCFIEAVENGETGEVVDYKKPFVEVFKYFKRMNLVVDVTMIDDEEDVDAYKTKDSGKWFTLDELVVRQYGARLIAMSEPAWWPDLCFSYEELIENGKIRELYNIYERGEGMLLLRHKDWRSKDLYLVNTKTRKAYHLVDGEGNVRAFTHDDIDPSVFKMEHSGDAHVLQVCYADLSVSDFKDGKARVVWMLYPDGRYFADEDGFGMEDNDGLDVAAIIDKHAHVVSPFRPY